jgi:hypothetical protein
VPDEMDYEIVRNVLVITHFGGGDRRAERRAILDVMRIKYLIEHIIKIPSSNIRKGFSIRYKADKHRGANWRHSYTSHPEDRKIGHSYSSYD